MLAEKSLREGKLQAALEALQEDVRRSPADPKLRVFLFQVLVVMGQWERALKQLQVAATLDAEAIPMAQTYRELIRCEALRREVFDGRRTPLVVGDPEPWLAQLLQALVLDAAGAAEPAREQRAAALELALASKGTFAGQSFDWFADGDCRLGPVLEAVIRGRYYWVPVARLQRVAVDAPSDLRDLVWIPATLHSLAGEEIPCFIPTRYPGSELHQDDSVRLARRTEWREHDDGTATGYGQRMFVTDHGDNPILELRSVEFDSPAATRSDEDG